MIEPPLANDKNYSSTLKKILDLIDVVPLFKASVISHIKLTEKLKLN